MYTADTRQADYITPLLLHSLATLYILYSCWRWLLYPLEEYQEVGRQPCNQETIDCNPQYWHVRRSAWQVILDWIASGQEIKVTKWSHIVATLSSRDLLQSHTISNVELLCFSTHLPKKTITSFQFTAIKLSYFIVSSVCSTYYRNRCDTNCGWWNNGILRDSVH